MLKTIILAGGKGTRMVSNLPKVLHCINDKSLIKYVVDLGISVNSEKIITVVGYKGDEVKKNLENEQIDFVEQKEQLGTGHAVMMAKNHINDDGSVLVLSGDTPLVTKESINKLIDLHTSQNNAVSVISCIVDNPTGYGRIKRDNEKFDKIVEEKDANDSEKNINEINTGIYIFKEKLLREVLDNLNNDNAQNEYYLTDALELLKEQQVGVLTCSEENEFIGINTKKQLSDARKIIQDKINLNLMDKGVIIINPETTYIHENVKIGMDSIIEPNVTIAGDSIIGDNTIIKSNSKIYNSTIGDGVVVDQSIIYDSKINDGAKIGPFAYLRPNSNIGKNVKIGDFVEIKNSTIGDNSKASHLSYIGDAELGQNINIGCGTITVNYDGKNKYKTTIEDKAFIGCNSNLIAPVTIKESAFVAAGTTVTKDVPAKSLVIGRTKEKIKENWTK